MLRPAAPAPSTHSRGITSPAAGGITALDVDRAADALLRTGERPTIEKVRAKIGRGSPNTINPLLDAWWSRLAGRLDAGPAALHRLPEPVLLAAEGLWLQALDDARRRAALEQGSTRKSLARDRQDLELRSHVLAIRESELADRLKQSESRAAKLELEVEALTTLLRNEQASRAAAERRLLESRDPATGRSGRAPQPTAAATLRTPKPRWPARTSSRTKPTPPRKVTPKTRSRPR
jgi:hypothetical protein